MEITYADENDNKMTI